MINTLPFPLIHQLPPSLDGKIPDALFFYGGDNEVMQGVSLPASKSMKNTGQILCLTKIQISVLVYRKQGKIEKNETEISLHFNFMDNLKTPLWIYRKRY